MEIICKGPEVELPAGISFQDKDGKVRHEVRVRWWMAEAITFGDAAIVPRDEEERVPNDPLPADWRGHQYSGAPVLFGHYWFGDTPTVISKQFACLDYSVAKGGPLVGYRWDGESELSSQKMTWV